VRSSNSFSGESRDQYESEDRVAKKLPHIALSKQLPTEPIEGRTPSSWQSAQRALTGRDSHQRYRLN
jgi:hypothetical protein